MVSNSRALLFGLLGLWDEGLCILRVLLQVLRGSFVVFLLRQHLQIGYVDIKGGVRGLGLLYS